MTSARFSRTLRAAVSLAVFSTLGGYPAWGGTRPVGARFLENGMGARALGMGSAFVAVSDDVTATYWNPAGLTQLSRREAAASHRDWIGGGQFNSIAFSSPRRSLHWGLHAAVLSYGSFERRGVDRSHQGTFQGRDSVVGVSFSRDVSPLFSGGVTVKWVQQKLADEGAEGAALDVGGLWKKQGYPVSAGFSVQNAGPKMNFRNESFHLPLSAAVGLGYEPSVRLKLAADLRHSPFDGRTEAGVGSEWSLSDNFSLRSGYRNGISGGSVTRTDRSARLSGSSSLVNGHGLTFGGGFSVGAYRVDYSFLPFDDLGILHQISMSVSF